MTKRALAAVTVAIVVVACGGESTTTTSSPGTDGGATITIRVFSFGDPVTISPGETVTAVNGDGLGHTWTSADGLFDSGLLDPGGEFTFTFEDPGEYGFFCSIHPSMTGRVTVEG